ncbi:flagellar basal body rod protein FlgB [Oleidesulfovibrio sp.]|uniref:flagellar basal body rod protein FlgB n=1 Tax=Oleidesulfovibrio sp. TaxID=2909707 RepID=UPI003A836C37
MKTLFGNHIEVTAKVMDMQLKRQNVIMSNMANVRTPGYKARELDFEKDLQAALALDSKGNIARTDEKHIPAAFDPHTFGPEWTKAFRPRVVHGEDQVDLDKEMSKMSKNTLQYNTLSTVMQSSFQGMKNIIQEGQK